jgi:putative endonuclease
VSDDARHQLGGAGERAAAAFLRRKGFSILQHNYRCAIGEIDLVARDGDVVVFVEVKTRRGDDRDDPLDKVHRDKQRRLVRAARHWLTAKRWPEVACRFDAVALIVADEGPPQIEHVEDAFQPGDVGRC